MARNFAQFQLRMWVDPEWTALTVEAQHLYKLLLSQEDIGASGLIPLRPRRWARLSRNGSVDKVWAALAELDEASFLVVDEDTAEVLVRTFIRGSDNYRNVRLLRAALGQAERVESDRIRSALGQELSRLPKVAIPERNERNGKAIEEARDAQRYLDEMVSVLNDAPPQGVTPPPDATPWGHPPVPVPVPVVGSCSPSRNESLEVDARANGRLLRAVGDER